jgi:transposase InsO family protein
MPRSSNATPWRVAQANTSTSPNGTLTPARNQARAIFAASTQQTGRVPGIFNTDQGGQFTSAEWIGRLEGLGVKVSMDGRGRWMDNVFIERLWRSVK